MCFLQVYKPVRALKPAQVLELGAIMTEMSARELQAVNLSDLAVVANLGRFKTWNPRKVRFFGFWFFYTVHLCSCFFWKGICYQNLSGEVF